jgi:hypothetical protein
VAHFDRTIPPGGEGKITLRINTRGYDGEMQKRAKVYTNDPGKFLQILRMRVFVKGPISLSPRYVYLRGLTGRKVTGTVRVRAEGNKPLKLEPSYFNLGGIMSYVIEEVEAGREFRVGLTSFPDKAGMYRGFLRLKTNYPERPEIIIWIKATFRKRG